MVILLYAQLVSASNIDMYLKIVVVMYGIKTQMHTCYSGCWYDVFFAESLRRGNSCSPAGRIVWEF
jgi:hypothetical protein